MSWSLQKELEELERSDPDVAKAARKYDEMVRRITREGRMNLVKVAEETVKIAERGSYKTKAGKRVVIDCETPAKNTRLFTNELVAWTPANCEMFDIEFTDETTLQAAQRLSNRQPLCCLNFASARHPGGGFLAGARAQEESLARSSGLYHCLTRKLGFYERHRESNGLYSNTMIYSPDVPVFRDDAGNLLDTPYTMNIISAPAVNVGALRQNNPELLPKVKTVMMGRALKVLALAASMNTRTLILGAWGCGIFQNDPEMIAKLFLDGLRSNFAGAFELVVFAIPDAKMLKVFQAA
jgi:uncharacterized protein (TIGR02452 family)